METEFGEARDSNDDSHAKKKSASGRAPALVTLSKAKGLLLSWGILRKAQDGVSLQCQDD